MSPYRGLISFQTLAELSEWALKNCWGARRTQQLLDFLSPFGVIHSNASLSARWAAVRVAAMKAGRPIDSADAWIAATALAVGCPLVTHNAADFAGVPGLSIVTAPGS
ncbi:PIN domain-containing protein [Deinococcus sp. YIM 134068]|uniref:PIN domain-containing protein n=1 Tax=Deinococcus lichenicola TaxID=3118910 RepID=UPI002F936DAC